MNDRSLPQLPKIGIGEAAKLYGMTIRAIRFYEEKGILPTHRDRQNRRYFDPAACRKLQWISLLRRAGLGLADISEVLRSEEHQGDGCECALTKLSAKRCAAEVELAHIEFATVKLREPHSLFFR